MSHSISNTGFSSLIIGSLTIQNYATGGEPVSPSEFGSNSVSGAILGNVPPSQNSLGVPLFPVLNGGKIVLYRFVSGSPVEIPTTANLGAVISFIVNLSDMMKFS